MAIYHFSVQMISRGKGQSAIASAAYRSGQRLVDEQTNESKFYKREVQPENHILAPENSPIWVQNREILWNEVEYSEKRKNSQLAREINVALPRELSNQQQTELIKDYIQDQFVDKGMVADIAIHRDDANNPHAHVMLTTREVSEEGFTTKNRDWNKKELLEQWREQWSAYANKALEQAQINERITHKSHADRGLEILPTVHMGHVASDMEKKGIQTERGTINREVQKHNAIVYDLQKYRQEKQQSEASLKLKEQKKAVELTPEEQKTVSIAKQIIGDTPTLTSIVRYVKQVEMRTNKQKQTIESLKRQNYLVSIAEQAEKQLSHYEKTLEELKGKLDKTGLFQRKEKEILRNKITQVQTKIPEQKEHLAQCLKEANLSKMEEIPFAKKQLSKQLGLANQKFHENGLEFIEQKRILKQTEEILKQQVIWKVVSHYPELQNAEKFLSFETACKLNDLNTKAKKIVGIDTIKSTIYARTQKIKEHEDFLQQFQAGVQRIQRVESYIDQLVEIEQRLQKIENNPLLKGQVLHSETAKKAYDHLLILQRKYQEDLKKEGYRDKDHFMHNRDTILSNTHWKDKIIKEIEDLQLGNHQVGFGVSTDFLSAIIQAVEQAQNQTQRVNPNEKQKERLKGQKSGLER
ncbi:MobQ family relaxase [Brevundimonas sp. NPDC058933]|uniref:MobQ family relaxase n=1 Tax=Brevundimonas sp. NPDC058933 TaxID=3346673 RepID=UPI003BEF2237